MGSGVWIVVFCKGGTVFGGRKSGTVRQFVFASK